ncbi:TIGR02680 family protein [Limnochorda pilosa]|uniref:TIGR02680 family protein n=1 Tax=Limnochorda pilosa TaxID=1555112 RepID=A0A0K2SLF0_LIMPI|nr:TIGR02680 family protein [Limnochorda pilosa]BAS27948.1 hypothetical protein LIP_2107 [Limnochorda pilosa]
MERDDLVVDGWDRALEAVNAALGGGPRRWRPSRLILQQYWHFEYQEFHFAQGRLVLRGANTTGKSTVLVSAITLALDGEKRRERMDTFGGQGRGVAYYLVGDADADETSDYYFPERTGYVALEFQRGDRPEYLTIGLGLYTSRTRPDLAVDSWGFVITDGRRIGRDLQLYTAQRLPLAARQLAETLGAGGRVFSRASDYQEEVNRQLFQFQNPDEYRFLLDLLIQIRSPKLNKDMKPSAICDLLSRSLPPLPEGILNRVTRIMDDIDSYLDLLKDLESRLQAVAAIDQAEAACANQMAQLAAVDYTEALRQAREVRGRLRTAEEELARTGADLEDVRAHLDRLAEERRSLVGRQTVLTQGDAYREVQQIELLRRDAEAARRALARLEEGRASSEAALERLEGRLLERRQEWARLRRELGEAAEQLQEGAPSSQWPLAVEEAGRQAGAARSLPDEPPKTAPGLRVPLTLLQGAAAERRRLLEEARRALLEVEARERTYRALGERAEERRRELEAADVRVREALGELEAAREQVRAGLEVWRGRLRVLSVQATPWQEVLAGVDSFGPDRRPGWGEMVRPVTEAAGSQRLGLEAARREEQRKLDALQAEFQPLEEELAEWKAGREVVPPRRPDQEAARRLLAELGVPAAPLYRVARFRAGIPEADRPLLEATLEASGLLDALVVDPGSGSRVAERLREAGLGDLWIDPSRGTPAGPTLLDLLEPDPDRAEALPDTALPGTALPGTAPPGRALSDEAVRAALGSIGLRRDGVEDGALVAVGPSEVVASAAPDSWVAPGIWRHGRLAGTGLARPEAGVFYLGRQAREAARLRRIASLEARLKELKEAIWHQEEALDQRRRALQVMEAEVEELRMLEVQELLPGRLLAVEQAEGWSRDRRRLLDEAEQAAAKALEALQSARTVYHRSLDPVPEARGRDGDGLRSLAEATDAVLQRFQLFGVLLERLDPWAGEWARLLQDVAQSRERLEKDRAAVREAAERLEEYEGRRRAAQEKLHEMGLSAEELLDELSRIEARLEEVGGEEKEGSTLLGALGERQKKQAGEVERLQAESRVALDELARHRSTFRGRLAAHPALAALLSRFEQRPAAPTEAETAEESAEAPGGAPEWEDGPEGVAEELLRLRRSAPGRLRESVERSVRDALQELTIVFSNHRPALAEYGPELQEERVAFRHRGTPVEAHRLRAGLESERDLQKRYLEQKERELYEQVILHEVAGEIRQRIRLAEGWRDEINRLLEAQRLSNGEVLSIAWLPRASQEAEALSYRRVIELLLRDADTLAHAEMEELIDHFRQRVNRVREGYRTGSLGEGVTFAEALHRVLDYREWFVFSLHSRLPNEPRRPLTDLRFASRSGAEKSLAMFVPLLAALHARYRAAAPDAPRLVGLDEAFAGVDETNIQEMYRFLVSLEFSWVMTSEKLWGRGTAVPACSTYELLRRGTVVTALWFLWDGRRMVLTGVPGSAGGAAAAGPAYAAGNGAVTELGRAGGTGAGGNGSAATRTDAEGTGSPERRTRAGDNGAALRREDEGEDGDGAGDR